LQLFSLIEFFFVFFLLLCCFCASAASHASLVGWYWGEDDEQTNTPFTPFPCTKALFFIVFANAQNKS
jgi:hypothetical protein